MTSRPAKERLTGAVGGVPERFVPEVMRGELVEAEHLARYRWAANFCRGKRVLDAGCGIGYGAELLARAGAAEVTAVDIAEEIVEVAGSTASAEVTFGVEDVRSLSYARGSFDVVVCFEVIEHVDEQDVVLDELARVLTADGLLLISSPNRDRYVPGNPHHRHEYLPEELNAALEQRFPAVTLVAQHVMLASVISAPGEAGFEAAQTDRLAEPGMSDQIYVLGIAGASLPEAVPPLVELTQFLEVRKWLEYMDDQARQLQDQARALQTSEAQRSEHLEALRQLSDCQQQLATALERAGDTKGGESNNLSGSELQRQLDLLQRRLDVVLNSRSWKLTQPMRTLGRVVKRR